METENAKLRKLLKDVTWYIEDRLDRLPADDCPSPCPREQRKRAEADLEAIREALGD